MRCIERLVALASDLDICSGLRYADCRCVLVEVKFGLASRVDLDEPRFRPVIPFLAVKAHLFPPTITVLAGAGPPARSLGYPCQRTE